MKKTALFLLALCGALPMTAQVGIGDNGYNRIDEDGNITAPGQRGRQADSLGTDKEIPRGLRVWTVDRRFGDRRAAQPDTLPYLFMNTVQTEGLRGEYNTTGNLGSPRLGRIFIDRREESKHFIFTNPYDFFITPVEDFHFTNTLSPITNLSYNTCGNQTNGEDHFTAKFGVNAGKRIGVGFKFDYLYGRGYYSSQATSHFNYSLYGSYLGDRYQAHLLATTNHQKVTENGGLTNDNYITHPEAFNESFQSSEIPMMLAQNWNRNDNQHVFFSHRYSLGYHRKVPMTPAEIEAKKFAMASKKEAEQQKARKEAEAEARREGRELTDEDAKPVEHFQGRPDGARVAERTPPADTAQPADSTGRSERITVDSKAMADSLTAAAEKEAGDTAWLKNEYVPVTSFIHTAEFNNFKRIYQAYRTPADYYLDHFDAAGKFGGDSIYDKTTHWNLRNTFAISLLEGFNKWAKAGVKLFATHELRHFALPGADGMRTWNEHAVSLGGQLSKTMGRTLHYNVTGEFGTVGADAGEISVEGDIDLNFPLFRDTMTLAASGFYHHESPSFYYRHYQSRHLWWDQNDMPYIDHLRIQGVLSYQKTRTTLRAAYDAIKNHTYFATTYTASDEGRTHHTVAVRQHGTPISLLTAEVAQDFTLGPLNGECVVTLQKSSHEDIMPLPLVNAYANLYLRFKVARVLSCDLGADIRYFTQYHAPEYVAALGQYAVQENAEKVEVGNYPVVNAYANFHLKRTRFFVMMTHVNAGTGKRNYFLTPHHPLNGSVLRFGLSWNFFN